MPVEDQKKWDRQHAQKDDEQDPSSFLREIFQRGCWAITPGRALDIATGKGRNALFLAERGFEVEAVDISPVAIEFGRSRARARSLRVSWRQEDLEHLILPKDCYDLILNFNYLQRSLIPQIKTGVKRGGYVIFDTYLVDQQVIGNPKNLAHLLRHNELLENFREFRVLYYREGKIMERGFDAFRAGILAQKLG